VAKKLVCPTGAQNIIVKDLKEESGSTVKEGESEKRENVKNRLRTEVQN
jgi:hypothetical protein